MKNKQTRIFSFCILGDFDLPSIDWTTHTVKPGPDHSMHSTFLEFVVANDLNQLIDFPTHNKGNLLDPIVTSMDGSQPSSEISASDHQISL